MHSCHMDLSPDLKENRWGMVSQSCKLHESKVKQVRARSLTLQDSPMIWCDKENHCRQTDLSSQTHLVRRVS